MTRTQDEAPKGNTQSEVVPGRFGAGLTEAEVRRLQIILREKCGADLSFPEAWSRAVELLSLVELLLQPNDEAL